MRWQQPNCAPPASQRPRPSGREVSLGAHARPADRKGEQTTATAIEAYLEAPGLAPFVAPIIGRAFAGPWRIKPNPEPVLAAGHALVGQAGLLRDRRRLPLRHRGAREEGITVIGYTNGDWKLAGSDPPTS